MRKGVITVILFLFLLFLPIFNFPYYTFVSREYSNSKSTKNIEKQAIAEKNNYLGYIHPKKGKQLASQYKTHSPIYIDGNSNLSLTSKAENWTGAGKLLNPYVINGLNITCQENQNLIEVRNTNVYFLIANNLLTQGKCGISIVNVTNCQIVNNIISGNEKYGLYFEDSMNNIIDNNNINGHRFAGIKLKNSRANMLRKNQIMDSIQIGISLELSNDNYLDANRIINSKYGFGVSFKLSNNNSLIKNNISGNDGGILLVGSRYCYFFKNIIINNGNYGIFIRYSRNNTFIENSLVNNLFSVDGGGLGDYFQVIVKNNTINDKLLIWWQNEVNRVVPSGAGQIVLINCGYIDVRNLQLFGISMINCSNIFIDKNNISSSYNGIHLYNSYNTRISNNRIDNNNLGIQILSSINNTLSGNDILENEQEGIYIDSSENNTLFNNSIRNNKGNGIDLIDSGNNSIINNNLVNNGFTVQGSQQSDYIQKTVENNSINGKMLIYWHNLNGGSVPTGASQVILVNCNAIRVSNLTLIEFFGLYCSNIDIRDNVIENRGIRLYYSNKTKVVGNTISNNYKDGIYLYQSKTIELIRNKVTNHIRRGVYLENSHYCEIVENTIENNSGYGISLSRSSTSNTIFNNNFIGNNPEGSSQAHDGGEENIFLKNYWSDWIGPDENKNGIVDIPYNIIGGENKQDLSPLTAPSAPSDMNDFLAILVRISFFLVLSLSCIFLIKRYSKKT